MYAIVDPSRPEEDRVLVILDELDEAQAIAAELRSQGRRVTIEEVPPP